MMDDPGKSGNTKFFWVRVLRSVPVVYSRASHQTQLDLPRVHVAYTHIHILLILKENSDD